MNESMILNELNESVNLAAVLLTSAHKSQYLCSLLGLAKSYTWNIKSLLSNAEKFPGLIICESTTGAPCESHAESDERRL